MKHWLFAAFIALGVPISEQQSQGGQDDILAGIFDVIQTTNQYYVEIGFNSEMHDGGSGSNTFALKQKGWHGLLLDGRFSNPGINLHQELVSSANIVQLMGKYRMPLYPDYVSIDIDTADLWIFKALATSFRPRVVSIEYNSQFPPESTIAFPDPAYMLTTDDPSSASIWEGPSCYMGSSAGAIYAAALEHHYVVVNASSGLDLILVRRDLWPWAVPSVAFAAGPPMQFCMKPDAMTPDDFVMPSTQAYPATIEKAAYWIDYATLQAGGDLCTARRKAHEELRAYAASFNSDRAASPCVRYLCFARLASLPLDPINCPPVQAQLSGLPAATGHDALDIDKDVQNIESAQLVGKDKSSPFPLWRELPINMDGNEATLRHSLSDRPDVLASRVIEHGKKHNWSMMTTTEESAGTTSLATSVRSSDTSASEAALEFAKTAAEKIIQNYHAGASAASMLI